MNRTRGFTLIELLVVMAIIALLIGILLPALNRARATAQLTRDGTQVRSIHQGWLIWARQFNGRLPTPGLIQRQPVQSPAQLAGQYVPGRGEEDYLLNTSNWLFSAAIMQNYFTPDICISTAEASSLIFSMDNYNWDVYTTVPGECLGAGCAAEPANGIPNTRDDGPTYWDWRFRSRVAGDDGSNVSYGHTVLAGPRKERQWQETLDSNFAVLGNRGPLQNSLTEYDTDSVTLEIHGGRRQWVGNIVYNDNHVAVHNTFLPEGLNYTQGGVHLPDNLFANDMADYDPTSTEGVDVWLVQYEGLSGSNDDPDDISIAPVVSQHWD